MVCSARPYFAKGESSERVEPGLLARRVYLMNLNWHSLAELWLLSMLVTIRSSSLHSMAPSLWFLLGLSIIMEKTFAGLAISPWSSCHTLASSMFICNPPDSTPLMSSTRGWLTYTRKFHQPLCIKMKREMFFTSSPAMAKIPITLWRSKFCVLLSLRLWSTTSLERFTPGCPDSLVERKRQRSK